MNIVPNLVLTVGLNHLLADATPLPAPADSAAGVATWLLTLVLVLIAGLMIWFEWRQIIKRVRRILAWLLDKCGDSSDTSRRKRDVDKGDVIAIGSLWTACILVGTVLVCYAIKRSIPHPVPGELFTALLWAYGCLVVGSFVGFLFGVPYVVQNEAATPTTPGKAAPTVPVVRYRANTALEQVAEWLTKMVVGVSLVQLTKVPSYLVRASSAMSGGYGNGSDSKAFGIALIIYFSFVGFLGAYLMTKLYLQAALMRSDTRTLGGAPQQANMTIEEVVALRDGTIGFNKRERVLTGLAAAAAAKLLREVDFEQLEDPQDFALWGKAAMSAGQFDDAIKAYTVACTKAPADVSFNLEYATALYLQERQRRNLRDEQSPAPALDQAEKDQRTKAAKCIRGRLTEAYHRLYPEVNLEVRRNVFKSLAYVYLWPDEQAEDYERTIDYGQEYQDDPHSAPSSSLCVYLASAFGQRAKALQEKWKSVNTDLESVRNQLTDPALPAAERAGLVAKQNDFTGQKSALDTKLEATKQRALKQVQMALRLDPTWSGLFRRLLGGREPDSDDLTVFKDDPLFQQVLGLTVIAAPQGVRLELTAPGTVRASWQPVGGAQKYLPFRQVVPGDPQPVPMASTTETSVLIQNLPSTGTLYFYVQAAYLDSESLFSDIVTLPLTSSGSSSTVGEQPVPAPEQAGATTPSGSGDTPSNAK